MHLNSSPPTGQRSDAAPASARSRTQRLLSLAYGFGLLLVFLVSLLLLPHDAGVGKLLWGVLAGTRFGA